MCGIVALIAPLPSEERVRLAEGMCELLAHRGPDDAGLFTDARTALTIGHRRLSIIDLSPDGRQPMGRGRLVLSYNGEVYNYLELRDELSGLGHPFRTRTDSEVVLAAFERWGDDAPAHMNGMFAILLWDTHRRRLLLVRDRFGVKPLYYLARPDHGLFLCASEPKALLYGARGLGLPIAPDADVLSRYLADCEIEGDERTFFRDVRRVLPGEMVILEVSGSGPFSLTRRRWYELSPHRIQAAEISGAAARHVSDERFVGLLTDAIRLRLRSDVPLGTCLSGGLDSSSLVCLAKTRLGVRLSTFSAVYGAGDAADESRFIDMVVERTGVENHRVDPVRHFTVDSLLRFIEVHDEPIGGTSVWAQHAVMRLAREHGMKVMLDGQGADETLTGYHGAFVPLFATLLGRAPHRLAAELLRARRLHHHAPLQALASAAWALARERALPSSLRRAYLERKWRACFDPSRQPAFRLDVPPLPDEPPHLLAWNRRSLLHGHLYGLIVGSSLQTILRYEDRNSMAVSIEARAPFLDYRLVEHCLGQPAQRLVQDGHTKAMLRRNLHGILPEQIRLRTDKIGFATPEGRWLRGPLRPILQDLLSSQSMHERGWFRVKWLRKAFTNFISLTENYTGGMTPQSATFWKALNVELWFRQHRLAG